MANLIIIIRSSPSFLFSLLCQLVQISQVYLLDKKSSKVKSDKKDCLIDESKGFKDPQNIYLCLLHQSCCLEYGKASCCGSKPILQILEEQVSLWGSLVAFLTLLGLIVYCRRRDFNSPEDNRFMKLVKTCCKRTTRSNKISGGLKKVPNGQASSLVDESGPSGSSLHVKFGDNAQLMTSSV